MQRQRIDITRAIMMQTVEFQRDFEIGLISEEFIVAITRNLCGIA
jgi:hypothetical protein